MVAVAPHFVNLRENFNRIPTLSVSNNQNLSIGTLIREWRQGEGAALVRAWREEQEKTTESGAAAADAGGAAEEKKKPEATAKGTSTGVGAGGGGEAEGGEEKVGKDEKAAEEVEKT